MSIRERGDSSLQFSNSSSGGTALIGRVAILSSSLTQVGRALNSRVNRDAEMLSGLLHLLSLQLYYAHLLEILKFEVLTSAGE